MAKALKIKEFPNYYITDTGDIYSRNYHMTGRIKKLKPAKNRDGYLYIIIAKDKKQYTKAIHHLVAEAFIPNPYNKPEINHKNGIKTDNRVENLEWCTRSENMKYNFSHLNKKPPLLGITGKLHPKSRVIQQIKNGKIIEEFYGFNEAHTKTQIDKSNIWRCCHNKRPTAGGYQWAYKK